MVSRLFVGCQCLLNQGGGSTRVPLVVDQEDLSPHESTITLTILDKSLCKESSFLSDEHSFC